MTLTSDLVLRILVSRPYLLYSLSEEFQIWCVDILGIAECHVPFLGHCDLDL